MKDDKTLIRANQGHSILVDVELEEALPPAILYHGTGEKMDNKRTNCGVDIVFQKIEYRKDF